MNEKSDQLANYIKKRDFLRSPEPPGGSGGNGGPLIFVVQKHRARSLHYDFRLELEGVLKSWAVPKGPSLEPGQKRLAVQVEDHPLEYAGFEGEIPAGQYGAGEVEIWDSGTWVPLGDPLKGLEKGHIKFQLKGVKLKGYWALVRMNGRDNKKEQWLLIREKDDHIIPGAKIAELPDLMAPQLATLVEMVPTSGDWRYEIKFDGYRILARIDKEDVRLFTRHGKDWTGKLGSLAAEVRGLGIPSGWLDGEVVVLGRNGMPDFGALQNAFEDGNTGEIIYYVFDLAFYEGYDLRDAALSDRKALLESIISGASSPKIRLSEDFGANGREILINACGLGMEGLIGKRNASRYVSERSGDWIKIKCRRRQEFIIVGYTESKRGAGDIGALLLGVFDETGQLSYIGKVGTGFDRKTSSMLRERLGRIETDNSILSVKTKETDAHWVLPEMAAEVSFTEWTKGGKVRHAVFHGLRSDKPSLTIKKEVEGNKISNPDRVVDQSTGFKKIDIVDYYRLAARKMLPYLEDRPVSFLRAPSGIEGEMFFQKHDKTLTIPGIKHMNPEFDPSHQPLLEIDSAEALIGAAQMNVVEFHTWNSTARNIEKPDRIVFDLDPGEGLAWSSMIDAAQLTRTVLEELGLVSFLKTSGGKGLHILVPIRPRDDWASVKEFSRAVSEHLAKTLPEIFTDVSGPRNRKGRVFVDYIRNNRGATTVAAFSVRARPGLGVSIPCAWEELSNLKGGDHWNISTARERLDSGEDPWEGYFNTRQILKAASKRMLGLK
ncbi:MAG: DNA ligase D [Clostridiaceae bacterium]